MNLFPNTNFHSLNLDWILSQIRKAVYSVNGQAPDANGNVNLATVAGVTAVNGVGPDGQGNVQLTPADVGALPVSYQAPVMSVNQKTGYVMLTPADVGALPASYQAPVDSVNGQTGAVVLDASDVGAIPDTYVAPVTSVNNKTGDVILDAADVGALADTTVIPDRTSQLINDSGFLTAQQAGAVTSVNSKVGAVVLDASDVGALPSTTVVPTLTSQLVNDSGFITSAQASPVQSVNGEVGNVVLDASDVGATPSGQGLPSGGASGQVLIKSSSTDFDATWADNLAYKSGDSLELGGVFLGLSNATGNMVTLSIVIPKILPATLSISTSGLTLSWLRGNGAAVNGAAISSVVRESDNVLTLNISGTVSAMRAYGAALSGTVSFS